MSLSRETMDKTREMAPEFRKALLKNVADFKQDIQRFREEYMGRGPRVPGIKPKVAVDRLKTFQREYEQRSAKMLSYQMGEELVGIVDRFIANHRVWFLWNGPCSLVSLVPNIPNCSGLAKT